MGKPDKNTKTLDKLKLGYFFQNGDALEMKRGQSCRKTRRCCVLVSIYTVSTPPGINGSHLKKVKIPKGKQSSNQLFSQGCTLKLHGCIFYNLGSTPHPVKGANDYFQ